jgi:site-specific DNA-methyltransferase (adenine-specific)
MISIIEQYVNDLIPYENNARINDKAIDIVANSIQEFGFKNPVIIDKNKVIVAGHTRVEACKKLGIDKVPCIIADDLTEEQIKAFRIADNSSAQVAEWDMDKLMAELETIDYDMSKYGLAEQMAEIEKIVEKQTEEDDFDVEANLSEEPKAKLGDVYKLGNHRLMCGDSTKEEDVAKLMNGNKADMVFTDPPYGYEYQSNMRTKTKKFDVLQNDDKILDFMPIIKDSCKGFVFVCTTWKVLDKWLPLFNKYFDLSNMIIWDKGGGGIGDLEHTFSTDYEIILCSNNNAKITGKRIGSVWDIPKDNANDYVHATQKPVKLSATAIENTTYKNDIVLDVFGGSGSTLIACEQLNRKCYMMELDKRYCDVIIKRWEVLTGKKAVRL